MQSLEFEAGYSRQGNLYAGDTQNTNSNDLVKENYGKETNRLYRNTYSVTWNGGWDNGVTTSNWAQYEHTRNSRKGEGLAGGTEDLQQQPVLGYRSLRRDAAQRSQYSVRSVG